MITPIAVNYQWICAKMEILMQVMLINVGNGIKEESVLDKRTPTLMEFHSLLVSLEPVWEVKDVSKKSSPSLMSAMNI